MILPCVFEDSLLVVLPAASCAMQRLIWYKTYSTVWEVNELFEAMQPLEENIVEKTNGFSCSCSGTLTGHISNRPFAIYLAVNEILVRPSRGDSSFALSKVSTVTFESDIGSWSRNEKRNQDKTILFVL
jgi:hypothetical protein